MVAACVGSSRSARVCLARRASEQPLRQVIGEGALGPISGQTEATYRATFDTNALGTLLSL